MAYRFHRPEARPSLDRLDIQLRRIQATHDHIIKDNARLIESHKDLTEQLYFLKKSITDVSLALDEIESQADTNGAELKECIVQLKTTIKEIQKCKDTIRSVDKLKEEVNELKNITSFYASPWVSPSQTGHEKPKSPQINNQQSNSFMPPNVSSFGQIDPTSESIGQKESTTVPSHFQHHMAQSSGVLKKPFNNQQSNGLISSFPNGLSSNQGAATLETASNEKSTTNVEKTTEPTGCLEESSDWQFNFKFKSRDFPPDFQKAITTALKKSKHSSSGRITFAGEFSVSH
ncbi:hypothetical protein FQR65_LT07927 [Abscondita terminalis]|nr:hypothetical protein FQR65_LT07927 [Abscondita terminalis]